MKQFKKMNFAHWAQDLGILGFLACIFCIILLMYLAQDTEQLECLLMFLVLCVPALFCAYKMPLVAYAFSGVQTLGYVAYKLYRYTIWGEHLTFVSYAWLFLPLLTISALRLFGSGVSQLENKNELLREQVEDLVLIDSLTGLYNRKGLYNELTRQIAHSKRNGENIVLMVIALKYAQELQGILSTTQFNHLLQKMAEVIEDHLRLEDRLYILKQDGTFALLLVNCDLSGASVVERRLRTILLDKNTFRGIVDQTIKVEVKIGSALYNPVTIHTAMDFLASAEGELQYDV